MKKQNLLVLGIMIVLIAAVAVFAAVVPQNRTISEDAPSLVVDTEAQVSEVEASEVEASEAPSSPEATEIPTVELAKSDAYLVVSVRGNLYEPIPLLDEGSFTVKQGEDMSNTIHVTPDSIWMEHSTCDNQDCVMQGTVSLDNMETRVLSNMIICLPNEVVLELHTPETLESVFGLRIQ